ALAADPSAFSGAVVFDPSAALDQPWTGPDRRLLTEMRAAVAAGRLSRAMTIFSRVVGLPGWQGAVVGALTALTPRYRPLVRCQVDDLEAMEVLGDRLSTYAAIATRTILLVGERSPARLVEVVAAIAAAMPNAERVTMPGRDHGADLKAPRDVAAVIRRLTP
ncbi:MAG: alpha/beta hydrolase, partial [Nonomuraea sp.]|nr:alpha/beta hydrolase [Nonomuraea sp.]